MSQLATKLKATHRQSRQRWSLVEKVRSRLQDLILSGKISPGERLSEVDLAMRFHVSRGPVREAIRTLEQAHLVTTVPNCGARVSRLELDRVLELYDVRAGLARSAGRLLAKRATGTEIAALQKLHEQMCAAAVNGSAAVFHRTNLQFHDLIFKLAGNARLHEIDQAVRNELTLFIRRGSLGDAQLRTSNAEHAAFLKAVAVDDAEDAARILEQHVLNGRQRMLENLRRMKSSQAMNRRGKQ
jgi:DNA-binding GntR family transcriptional regulator